MKRFEDRVVWITGAAGRVRKRDGPHVRWWGRRFVGKGQALSRQRGRRALSAPRAWIGAQGSPGARRPVADVWMGPRGPGVGGGQRAATSSES